MPDLRLSDLTEATVIQDTDLLEISVDAGSEVYNESKKIKFGTLQQGATQLSIQTVSNDYTIQTDDNVILVDASGGQVTLDLPAASSIVGKRFYIKKIDSTGNFVTLDPNGSETIDESTTIDIGFQYTSVTIVSDGTEWWIL